MNHGMIGIKLHPPPPRPTPLTIIGRVDTFTSNDSKNSFNSPFNSPKNSSQRSSFDSLKKSSFDS